MSNPIIGAQADIIRVKVPLPFQLRWVNSYLIRGRNGYTVIDPGLHTPEAEQVWEETLRVGGLAPADIEQIVLTHHHPDHYGLAGWLQERSGAPVWLSEAGMRQVNRLWGEGTPLTGELHRLFVQHGMNGEHEAEIVPHMNSFVQQVSPQPDVRILPIGEPFRLGDREYETIHTPGHAFGHVCFYDREHREMVCGDHVLPQISPNVSYLPGVDEAPLASFLESLRQIGTYGVSMAYPGHRDPFAAFEKRVRELIAHHDERLDLMQQKLAGKTMNAYELCLDLFGTRLTIHQLRFAISETIAHLIHLRDKGRIQEHESGGLIRYSAPLL